MLSCLSRKPSPGGRLQAFRLSQMSSYPIIARVNEGLHRECLVSSHIMGIIATDGFGERHHADTGHTKVQKKMMVTDSDVAQVLCLTSTCASHPNLPTPAVAVSPGLDSSLFSAHYQQLHFATLQREVAIHAYGPCQLQPFGTKLIWTLETRAWEIILHLYGLLDAMSTNFKYFVRCL